MRRGQAQRRETRRVPAAQGLHARGHRASGSPTPRRSNHELDALLLASQMRKQNLENLRHSPTSTSASGLTKGPKPDRSSGTNRSSDDTNVHQPVTDRQTGNTHLGHGPWLRNAQKGTAGTCHKMAASQHNYAEWRTAHESSGPGDWTPLCGAVGSAC